MALGFVLRIIFAGSPYSSGLYIIMDLVILLSPCAFLATDYMLLARLVATFNAEISQTCLLIRPSLIVRIFVASDGTTFLLQATGGGLSSQNTASSANLGKTIAMIGLGLQLVSFALFTVLLAVFGLRLPPFKVRGTDQVADCRVLYYTMCLTCIGILIRSIFRIAEFAGGYTGFIATHEGYFYLFDALPLWVAMSLYCLVWPPRFLDSRMGGTAMDSVEAIKMRAVGRV
ncbi:RTA-like protein [Mycena rosella]|uniref:RTA-like protein n=1 Tax=Mycena rosella TaxID=1033263 RepID=A0AAD7G5N7_MYCRO|nr:RTA-like protein [Mycena rosella]